MMRSIRRVLKKCGLDAVRKNLGRLVGKLNNLDPKVYPRVKSKFEATQTSLRGVGVTQQRREDATVTTFKTSRKDGINKWKTYYSTAATSPKNVYPNAEAEKSLILAENKDRVGVYCWTNLISGNKYVGSSASLGRRLGEYYSVPKLVKQALEFR